MAVQEIEIRITGLPAPDARQIAAKFGWQPKLVNSKGEEIDNPETAKDFYERHLETLTIELLRSAEQETAAIAAREAAGKTVEERIGGKKKKPALPK